MSGGSVWNLQRFLQCINDIILEFALSTALLYPPSPDSWDSFKGIIFAFTYMCTHFLHHIHPPTPFPCYFCPPTGTNPPPLEEGLILPSSSLILWKKKREKIKRKN
jgi:hypothetical protein